MATGGRTWREVWLVAAVMVVVAGIVAVGLVAVVGVTVSSIQGAQGSRHSAEREKSSPSDVTTTHVFEVGRQHLPIDVRPAATSVAANDVLRLTGRYRQPAHLQDLHVQLDRHGRWITFPLPAVTMAQGHFKAFVELAHRGPNRLRMIDRGNGAVSNVTTVTVR